MSLCIHTYVYTELLTLRLFSLSPVQERACRDNRKLLLLISFYFFFFGVRFISVLQNVVIKLLREFIVNGHVKFFFLLFVSISSYLVNFLSKR